MKTLITILLLAALPASADTITTISGTTYSDASVTKTTPAAISITHSTGMAKIPFKDLPAVTQKKYGYDPAKAAEYEEQEAQRQAEQKQRAETQRLQAEQENTARQQASVAKALENARKEAAEIEKSFEKAMGSAYIYETSTLGAQAALNKGAREMSQADYSAGMDELKTDLRDLGGKYANLANSGVGIKPIAEALGFDADEENPKRLLLEVQQEIVKMQAERGAKKKPLYQTTPLAMILSDPKLRVPFLIKVKVEVATSYGFRAYRDARESHFAFQIFDEKFTHNARGFMRRDKGEAVRNAIASKGGSMTAIIKGIYLPEMFDAGSHGAEREFEILEVIEQ
jgi:hypothetical protein